MADCIDGMAFPKVTLFAETNDDSSEGSALPNSAVMLCGNCIIGIVTSAVITMLSKSPVMVIMGVISTPSWRAVAAMLIIGMVTGMSISESNPRTRIIGMVKPASREYGFAMSPDIEGIGMLNEASKDVISKMPATDGMGMPISTTMYGASRSPTIPCIGIAMGADSALASSEPDSDCIGMLNAMS